LCSEYNNHIKTAKVKLLKRACSTHGEKRNTNKVLMGKPEGKSPLGRPRLTWEDNIQIHLREIGCCGMNWIQPSVSIKYEEILE
jgi:hypothetical protein